MKDTSRSEIDSLVKVQWVNSQSKPSLEWDKWLKVLREHFIRVLWGGGNWQKFFLCSASALEVLRNFMDISFELQFQEGIHVTGRKKKELISMLKLPLLSFFLYWLFSQQTTQSWITHCTASLSGSTEYYGPDKWMHSLLLLSSFFFHPFHFTQYSIVANGHCCYMNGWYLEMAPSLSKAPCFNSRGVHFPHVHIIKCSRTGSFLQLFLLWAWSYFGKLHLSHGVLSSV